MPTTSTIKFSDKNYKLEWIKDDNLDNYNPVKQVYAVVFNDKEEVLICRGGSDSSWQIPGGTPEENESNEEALKRELLEEVDVTVKNITPLGAQKVTPLNENGNILKSGSYYQFRYVAIIDELLEQTEDPSYNRIWERKLIPFSEIENYIKWGEIGTALFNDALEVYKSLEISNN